VFGVTVDFPKMKVGVVVRDGRVVEIRYLPLSAPSVEPGDPVSEKAKRQLERYRDDPDATFDLPILVEGTELQKRVWQAMCAIPRGKTRTYGEIAKELGGDPGVHAGELNRAVGQACGDNKLPIVIPCHRVVAANGIGGFAHSSDGYLIEAKRWLLNHEIRPEEFELKG
jgi:methylated-DNA-[protein]-cysteine S-methyltransferase